MKPTSSSSADAISDSLSLICRCNLRILSKPTLSLDSESLKVNKNIGIGNAIGFNMVGKEPDVAHVLGTDVNNSFP
ncbi:hypothetical protein Tco_0198229 [Tanacetum coccineum]